ncbi:microcephalin [Patella vulgata]|uniref:microcephalin n=1 Tax=Patella vulgata TaxID=6465 RepID=UPI0024A8242D|nr:microcephalin [Patella vulgata]
MNKRLFSGEDSPSASDFDFDTTLERNISQIIDVLDSGENSDKNEQSDSSTSNVHVLEGVRAYVEVRTNNDNRSEAVCCMLRNLGAEIEKTFTSTVTHVIFKDGTKRTIDKAKKKGLHLVSVLWVDSCMRNKRHVTENMYPAVLPEKNKSTPIFFKRNRLKKMKSMQPNDFDDDVARSSERYERKRKKEEERLGLSGNTTPVASPRILAYDTVPRSPPSPSDWRSPIPLVIPNTPASMKDQISKIRQARLNSSECSGTDSPLVGVKPFQPLHRKLFNGNESSDTPTGEKADVPVRQETDEDNSNHSNNKMDSSCPETVSKRKLFNVLNANSPKPFLVKPTHSSESNLPNLTNSNPRLATLKKVTNGAKLKGRKRKIETESDNSLTENDKTPKRSKTLTKDPVPLVKPVKNIHAQYLADKLDSGSSSQEKPMLESIYSKNSEEVNSKASSHRRSSRRSSVLSKSNNSSLSDNSTKTPDCSSTIENVSLKSKKSSLSENRADTPKLLNRRVSIAATPDLSTTSINSPRRSSRRMSVASFPETESPNITQRTKRGTKSTTNSISENGMDNLHNQKSLSPSSKKCPQKPKRLSRQFDLVHDETIENADSSRNETTGFLGASMSTVFGDSTLASLNLSQSRRSIDDFKIFTHKKNKHSNVLSSISENDQNTSKTTKRKSKSTKHKSNNKVTDVENLSMELPDDETGKHVGSNVSLRRANSFCREKTVDDISAKATRPTIVMTSMHTNEQEVVSAVVKKLGGFLLVDNVCDTTTHVVCGDSRRTLNIINGMARGCWMVYKEWVLKSLDNEEWLDEEDYELCDTFPQVKITRKERQLQGKNYQQTLFTDIGSVFISSKCLPPRSAVVNLLRLCGGQVTGSASRCDIFIGNDPNRNKTSIKPVWILDCIMEQKLLNYNQPKYLLNQTFNRESSPEF